MGDQDKDKPAPAEKAGKPVALPPKEKDGRDQKQVDDANRARQAGKEVTGTPDEWVEITPPAAEPVSYVEAEKQCRLDDDGERHAFNEPDFRRPGVRGAARAGAFAPARSPSPTTRAGPTCATRSGRLVYHVRRGRPGTDD